MIIVLVKQVPDTYGERKLDMATGLLNRSIGDRVIDEINERALETPLSYKDSHNDAEIIVLSMGPATAAEALRKALSMGADAAVHVVDDALVGSDLGLTPGFSPSLLRAPATTCWWPAMSRRTVAAGSSPR